MITTARLTLEPLSVAHADEMAAVLAAPALYAFTGGTPPTLDDLRHRYRLMVAGPPPGHGERWLNWVLRRRDDGRLVGTVQATVTGARQADVAWTVGAADQGHGYATEAAHALVAWLRADGTTRISAHIHPAHAASQAVARRIGLAPTGELVDGEVRWTGRSYQPVGPVAEGPA